ncbi:hypothetical protein ACEPAI_2424 [Sanghuangporus weigelae]
MVDTSIIPPSLLDSTFGCLFLAVIFSSVFWGIGCLQLYLYCEKYWNTDGKWFKSYIFSIWILDTAHQALLLNFNYVYFVKGIIQPELLLRVSRQVLLLSTRLAATEHSYRSSIHCAIITAFIDAMVQAIFVRRAWYVSKKNKAITAVLCIAILVQFAITTAYYGQIYSATIVTQLTEAVHTELAMNYIVVCTDALLAGVLVWLLYRSRSGVKRTDSIVNRVIMYTIGSGLVPAVWAIVAAIGAQVSPRSVIYLLVDLVIPKLYFNCMLASLNVRSSLRSTPNCDAVGLSFRLDDLNTVISTPVEHSNDSSGNPYKISGPRSIECRIDIDIESGFFQQEDVQYRSRIGIGH